LALILRGWPLIAVEPLAVFAHEVDDKYGYV
jgi:hypothetical protein